MKFVVNEKYKGSLKICDTFHRMSSKTDLESRYQVRLLSEI